MCLEGLACLNEGTESASTAQQYTLRKEPDAGNLLRCRYHRFYRKKNHTMAPKKKVSALLKLQIQAGKANPAPPPAAAPFTMAMTGFKHRLVAVPSKQALGTSV